ncbi:MAG: MarR family winged helix-turn-helix transcriptional regulator, partial [Saprospiraceae bacterium]
EKLKKKGLVEREASDDDRRRVNVYITSAGLELLQKATQAIDDQVEKKMKKINTEHIQLLNSILDELRG